MKQTKPKTVLITGASSGFGQKMAIALAAAGYQVFGTSRKPMADQGDARNPVRMLVLDVTDDQSAQACIEDIDEIDVLINNAGSGLTGAIEDCSSEEVAWQMETNFHGPVRMIRHVLPKMRKSGGGRIINIGSLGGHAGMPYQGVYSASKFALEGLNEALRLELRGSGIDATIVCPGDFKTGFTAARVFASGAQSAAHAQQMKTTVGIYEHDETNGAPAEVVAKLIQGLVETKRLRVRYFVGRFDQTAGMSVKRILPGRVFEWVMAKIYKLP